MFGIDGFLIVHCSSNKSSPGEMIRFSVNTAGALVNGSYSGLVKKHVFDACNLQMMQQVILHLFTVDADEVTFGDHPVMQEAWNPDT